MTLQQEINRGLGRLQIDHLAKTLPVITPAMLQGDILDPDDMSDEEIMNAMGDIGYDASDYDPDYDGLEEGGIFDKIRQRRRRRKVANKARAEKARKLRAMRVVKKGGITPATRIFFIDTGQGANVLNSKIGPQAYFTADERNNNILNAFEDGPYQTAVFTATSAGGLGASISIINTQIIPGVSGIVKVPFLIIKLNGNTLNAKPGTYKFQVLGKDGRGTALDLGDIDIAYHFTKSFSLNMVLTAWRIITTEPQPLPIGVDAVADSLKVTVPGIADNDYTLEVHIPGTNHPVMKKFRRALQLAA